MLERQQQVPAAAYGAVRSVCRFCLAAALGWLLLLPHPAGASDYAASLQEQAAARKLHAERAWEVLLHYRPSGSGQVSLVDDPAFFLSPEGKMNPAAELAATITAFLDPPESGDDHAQCRFPARYQWLKEELALDEGRLPRPACSRLTEALATIDPRSAVLVFPASHPNSPASMFGHTLLRVGSTYRSDLLGYAINYAAVTTDTNGLVYAYKGIFGQYPGYYSTLPYYEKVKEYNDLEHRDIWEYQLKLSPAEVDRMARHTWELLGISSDYFFFDENCSFNLLFLLEAARPELKLAQVYWDRLGFWVIPVDTIQTVKNAGLTGEATYRPALATRIRHRAAGLDPGERRTARSIARGELAPELAAKKDLPPEKAQRILDVAADYLQYRYSRQEMGQEEFQRLFRATLSARSRLGTALEVVTVPTPTRPEEGHRPGRIAMGGGVRRDVPFLELSWRAAYHDLLDPPDGFTEGAQILFTELAGRYQPQNDRLLLERFKLVDIISIAPRDEFFSPFSWKVNGGLERRLHRDGEDHLLLRINTGGGYSRRFFSQGLGYAFLEADLNLGDELRDKAAVGAGASAGLVARLTDSWQMHLRGEAFGYAPDWHQSYRLSLDQGVALGRTWALQLRSSWESAYGRERGEATLSLARYF